jgi:2-amino-4-hydroxy-6-hydroxymethyldihydropteridine diphosphokinase
MPALVGLGSNLGDRRHTLEAAVVALGQLADTSVVARSTWYETMPVGGPAGQEPFLNGCVVLNTTLAPEALLDELCRIEATLGRERVVAWGPRTIDLDLLLYDDLILRTERLQVPHPRLAFRKFVLRGAAEVAAAWRHPLLEQTIGELQQRLEVLPNYLAFVGQSSGFRTQFAAEAADAARARLVDPTPADVPASVDEVCSHGLVVNEAIEFFNARDEAVRRSIAQAHGMWVVDDAWPEAELISLLLRVGFAPWRRPYSSDVGPLMLPPTEFPEPKLVVCLQSAGDPTHGAVLALKRVWPELQRLPAVVDVDIADREAALAEIAAAMEAAGDV